MWIIIQEPFKNLSSTLDIIGMSGNVSAKTLFPKRPGPRPQSERFVNSCNHLPHFSRLCKFVCLSISQSVHVFLFLGANNEALRCEQ